MAEAGGDGHASATRPFSCSPTRARPPDRTVCPVLVAGPEVVGRELEIWRHKDSRDSTRGCVREFNRSSHRHLVCYNDRGHRFEEWVDLERTQFVWLSGPGSDFNPTYQSSRTPQGEEALQHKVAVFWSRMGKWYKGKVHAFNQHACQHEIAYSDGDDQWLDLRHEAVMWLDVPGLASREELAQLQGLNTDSVPEPGPLSVGKPANSSSAPAKSALGKRAGCSRLSRPADTTRSACPRGASRLTSQALSGGQEPGKDTSSRRPPGSPSVVHRGVKSIKPQAVPALHPAVVRVKEAPHEAACSSSGVSEHQGPGGRPPARSLDAVRNHPAHARPGLQDDASSSGRQLPQHGPGACEVAQQLSGGPASPGVASHQLHTPVCSPSVPTRGPATPHSELHSLRTKPPAKSSRLGSGRGRGGGRGSSTPRGEPGACRRGSGDSPGSVAGQLVRGARVAVWWSHDEAWYRGEVKQYDSYHKRSKVLYDDLLEEWLALPRAKFQCLLPRARSAGCTQACVDVMRSLGAVNVPSEQEAEQRQPVSHSSAGPEAGQGLQPPPGKALIGWRLTLTSPATQEQYKGEVIGFRKEEGGQHLVLYDDGEDEWVDVSQEEPVWQAPLHGPPACVAPGLPPGDSLPRGRAAVGWRIGVYWKDDQKFYYGEVVSFDASTGRSMVVYTDGEREPIVLGKEKVKWVLPPGVRAAEDVASDSDDDGTPRGRPLLRARSGRKWEDDDSETSGPCPPARGVDMALLGRSCRASPPAPQPQFVRSLGPLRSLKSRLGARLPIRRIRVFCQATDEEPGRTRSSSHREGTAMTGESVEVQADTEASREPSQLRGSGDQADSGPQAPEPADVCLVSVPHPSPGDAGLLQDPQRPDGAASCSAPPSPNQPPESSPVLPRVVTTLPPSGPSPRVSSLDVLPPQRGGWGAASRHSSAGWSSPGIAHYLGAELPTTENGLASSLKILSRGDSGLMCLANNELQPRKEGLMSGTLYQAASLGKGPSTPILVEELCARLNPLQRLDSCLNPSRSLHPPHTAQASPEPCLGISRGHTPARGTGSPCAQAAHPLGAHDPSRTSLERLHPQPALAGQHLGVGLLSRPASQPVVCGGTGMLANLGTLLGQMGPGQDGQGGHKRSAPSSCRASAEAGCSQPPEGLLGGEGLTSDAKRMKLTQQC